jgi:hypothetical protein
MEYSYITNKVSNNYWIAAGIKKKVSCKWKKYLYIMSKTTNYSTIKEHYTQYCRGLQKIIRKTKEIYCNELSWSTNKSKTSGNIISNETGTASSKKFTQTEF